MADSSETDWQPRLGEQFIFGGRHYDLAKAKGLIKGAARPVENGVTGAGPRPPVWPPP